MFLEKGIASPRDPADCKQCRLYTLILYQRLNIAFLESMCLCLQNEPLCVWMFVLKPHLAIPGVGGHLSLRPLPNSVYWGPKASQPLLHPGQGAGPGGGSHWRGPARRPLPGKAQGPSGVGRRRWYAERVADWGSQSTSTASGQWDSNPACVRDFCLGWEKSHSVQIFEEVPFLLGTCMVAQKVKNLPAKQETCAPVPGWEDPLEKGVAMHSIILS